MTVPEQTDERFQDSGDEAGTAPGDRRFRPDIEGLRAVAILLVVLYHAGVPHVTGGFVGVDVFFVISGFVITGLLLRERSKTEGTSLLAFYARRARRLLPAATVVIVVALLASYHYLGFLVGNQVASDSRYAALFAANFHFISEGTNYLTAQLPPSPLQHFWSLSVEEQFYLLFPTLFIITATVGKKLSLRSKLTGLLAVIIIGSYIISVVQTSHNATAAYFSPFARAWELGLGSLIATSSQTLRKVPKLYAAVATWIGFALVVAAAIIFDAKTHYPGSIAVLPVVGAGLIVAGGAAAPDFGVEYLLRIPPFQWLGKLSYSLYLWHWPILIIAEEHVGHPLSVGTNLLWVLLAVAISVVSYFFIESPIRHNKTLAKFPWASVGVGLLLIAVSVSVATFEISSHH